ALMPSLLAQGASTLHVFPQMADGSLSDGTYYVSSLIVTNTSGQTATCTIRLYGGLPSRFGSQPAPVTLSGGGSSTTLRTPAAFGSIRSLVTGYATVSCSQPVSATVEYMYLAANGVVLSGTTVFSSPAANKAQFY